MNVTICRCILTCITLLLLCGTGLTGDARRQEADQEMLDGTDKRDLGSYEEALETFQRAREIYRELNDTKGEISCLGNICELLILLHRYDESIVRTREEIALRRSVGEEEKWLEGPYGRMALAFERLGQYEEALEYRRLKLDLILADEEGFDEEEAFCREAIADLLSKLGKYEASILEYNKALEYYETMRENDIFESVIFIRFDVSSIPPHSVINSALLHLYYHRWGDNDPVGRYLSLYRVTDDWSPRTMTYNTQPSVALWPSSFSTIPSEFGWMTWDVTADVQAFVDGKARNCGWKLVDEDYWGKINIPSVQFYAKDCHHSRPHLEIELAFGDRRLLEIPSTATILHSDASAQVGRPNPDLPGPTSLTMMVRNKYGAPVRKVQVGRCYRDIGEALEKLGKHEKAIEYQERALDIFRKVPGEERDRAEIHRTIGLMLNGFGRPEECIENQERALDLYEEVGDAAKEKALCHLYIGNALRDLGRLRESILHHQLALALCKGIDGTEPTRGACYRQMAITFERLGDYRESMATYQRALETYAEIPGAEWEMGLCYWGMGEVLLDRRRPEDALVYQERAMVLFGAIEGRTADRALAHAKLAHAYVLRGERADLHEASTHIAEALLLAEEFRGTAVGMEARMGISENIASVYAEAVSFLMKCAEVDWVPQDTVFQRWCSSSKTRDACLEIAFHFAEACKARTLLDLALERIPEVKDSVSLQWLKADAQLLNEIRALHSRLMSVETGEEETASKLRLRIKGKELERDLIEYKLRSTLIGKYRAPPFNTAVEVRRQLDGETAILHYVVGEHETVLLVLTDSTIKGWSIPVDRDMPEGMWEGKGSRPERLERAFEDTPSAVGLTGLVRLYRNWMENVHPGEWEYRIEMRTHLKVGRYLHDLLLPEGTREMLKDENIFQLIVVPDGILHLLPFDALITDSKTGDESRSFSDCRYLVEDYVTSRAPSVALLQVIRGQREAKGLEPTKGVWGIGYPICDNDDPRVRGALEAYEGLARETWSFLPTYYAKTRAILGPIPKTEEEVLKIAALFPDTAIYRTLPYESSFEEHSSVFLGRAACMEALRLAPLGNYRYIHFATHGLVDERNPWLSCLLLTGKWEGGEYHPHYLKALDIFGLELNADLVTLSACETGLGRQISGEGMVGLVTAFFHAGAKSAVVSLWRVASGETGELMEHFYTRLSEGEDRATALRAAKLEMIKKGKADPSYWAAFVLHGLPN